MNKKNHKGCEMQEAEVVLGVLRERGRRELPCTQLYRQMFNSKLYLLAYGNIYPNQGAMTPGVGRETADGMSEEKIEQIIEAMRHGKYRFTRPLDFRGYAARSSQARRMTRISSGGG